MRKKELFLLLVATLILCGSSGCARDARSIPTPTPVHVLAPSPTVETHASPATLAPSPMAAKSTDTPRPVPTETPTPSTTPVDVLAPSPTVETPAPPTMALVTPTPQMETETDPAPAEETLSIPLGIGIWDADNVTVFNRYAREQDVIAARLPYTDLLEDVEIGQKMVFLASPDEADTEISSVITEAKVRGVTMLGYNLETALPKDALVGQETQIQGVASEAGLLYAFAPTLRKLLNHYDDFAQHADIIILQSQRFQARKEYEERVEKLIARIRSANPEAKVWVQVSVNPPEKPDMLPDEVISDIQLVADKADLIWIFFAPEKASVMEEVFRRLRQ